MRACVVLLLSLSACKPVAVAPEELNELVGYLYTNFAEEDPAPLEAGALNLDTWLDGRLEETLEGYSVDNLTQESITALGDGEQDLEGLAGAAVGHASSFGADELALAIIADDPMEIYTGTYLEFDRSFQSDKGCFTAGTCDWLEAEVRARFAYPLGLQVETHSWVQYRWVESELGPVYVERTWLREPAVVSLDFLEVNQQYYLRMVVPDGAGSRSIQVTWVVARMTGDSVPEDVALNLVIDSMSNQAATLDEWIEAK